MIGSRRGDDDPIGLVRPHPTVLLLTDKALTSTWMVHTYKLEQIDGNNAVLARHRPPGRPYGASGTTTPRICTRASKSNGLPVIIATSSDQGFSFCLLLLQGKGLPPAEELPFGMTTRRKPTSHTSLHTMNGFRNKHVYERAEPSPTTRRS